MNTKGFSLIETVLYLGLFSILIPSFLLMTLGFVQKSDVIDVRVRMEEKAGIIISELQNELLQADSIDVTNSTFGTSDSSLVYVNSLGSSITIDRVEDAIQFVDGEQQINRLQRQSLSGNEWMTDADMEVTVWNVDIVRDSAGTLTGLNFQLIFHILNSDGSPFRDVEVSVDTTIHLQFQTTEL